MKPYYDANGITLYCGDCLTIMAELEAQSFDAVLNWEVDVIPLHPHVALVTKADDVIKRVRIVHVLKRANRFNVMNIGFTGCLNSTTAPASIFVSEACGALNWTPILTIVVRVPAAPIVAINATVSAIGAFPRAETEAPRSFDGCRDSNSNSACFTGKSNRRLRRRARRDDTAPASLHIARLRTNGYVFGSYLCRFPSELRAAHLTYQFSVANLRSHPQRIRTFTTARRLTTVLQSLRIGKI